MLQMSCMFLKGVSARMAVQHVFLPGFGLALLREASQDRDHLESGLARSHPGSLVEATVAASEIFLPLATVAGLESSMFSCGDWLPLSY